MTQIVGSGAYDRNAETDHPNESFFHSIKNIERKQPLQGDRVIPAKGHEVGTTECQSK